MKDYCEHLCIGCGYREKNENLLVTRGRCLSVPKYAQSVRSWRNVVSFKQSLQKEKCGACSTYFWRQKIIGNFILRTIIKLYKAVQIWPGLIRLVYTQISPGHIWTTLYFMNFMVAPCINNIKHFIVQLMHTNYKILRLLK